MSRWRWGIVHSSGTEDAGFVAARRIVTFNAASDTAGRREPVRLEPHQHPRKGSSVKLGAGYPSVVKRDVHARRADSSRIVR